MNAVIPTMTDYGMTGVLALLGGIIAVGLGILLSFRTTNFVGLGVFLMVFGILFGVPLGITLLVHNGEVARERTISAVEQQYGVTMERHTDLPDFAKDSSFSTIDVIDIYTNEVHEDARLVWNGVELTLLVKDDAAQEYVPMISSE